jgi:hypothetical protein
MEFDVTTCNTRLISVVPTSEEVHSADSAPPPQRSNAPSLAEIGPLARANHASRARGGRIAFLADMDNARLLWVVNFVHGLKGKKFDHYAYETMKIKHSDANKMVLLGDPEFYDDILRDTDTARRMAESADKPFTYQTWQSIYRKLKPPTPKKRPEDEEEEPPAPVGAKLMETMADLALAQQTTEELRTKVDTTISELEKALAAKEKAEQERDAALVEAAALRRELQEQQKLAADLMIQLTREANDPPGHGPEPILQEAVSEPSSPDHPLGEAPEPVSKPKRKRKPTPKPNATGAGPIETSRKPPPDSGLVWNQTETAAQIAKRLLSDSEQQHATASASHAD